MVHCFTSVVRRVTAPPPTAAVAVLYPTCNATIPIRTIPMEIFLSYYSRYKKYYQVLVIELVEYYSVEVLLKLPAAQAICIMSCMVILFRTCGCDGTTQSISQSVSPSYYITST